MRPHRPLGLLRPLATRTMPAADRATVRRRGAPLDWRRVARARADARTDLAIHQSWPVTITLHCRTHIVLSPAARPPAPAGAGPIAHSPNDALRLWSPMPPDPTGRSVDVPSARALTRTPASAPDAKPTRPGLARMRLPPPAAIAWHWTREIHSLYRRTLRLATSTDHADRRSATMTSALPAAPRRRSVARPLANPARATPPAGSHTPLPVAARRTRLALPVRATAMLSLASPAPATPPEARHPSRPAARTPLRLAHRPPAPADRSRFAAVRAARADLVWAERAGGRAPGSPFAPSLSPAFSPAFSPVFSSAFSSAFSPGTAPSPAAVPLRAQPSAAPPPAPDVDRLVDAVMRRIERHNRSEKLRRGL